MLIDNKLITLRKTAGYVLEHVLCLWYAKKNTEKRKEN